MPVHCDPVERAGRPARQYDGFRGTSRTSADGADCEQPAASQPGDESPGLYRQAADTRGALELSQTEADADARVAGSDGAAADGKGEKVAEEITASSAIRR